MARTGSWGRAPRAVPSLTNTLVAIAREQEQRRDQNIMDAWQKGGMFEGQKATDELVLAHWKQRLEGISKDDPLYDTYKNAVLQYEYSIAESKATTAYAKILEPSTADDQHMANFYLNWAKKVPEDSEFYRILQRDAAQFMRSAHAKATQRARVDEEAAYKAQLLAIENKSERGGQFAVKVLTMLAQNGSGGQGAILRQSPMGGLSSAVDNTNLGDIGVLGTDNIMWLLSQVTPSGAMQTPAEAKVMAPAQGVLFRDDQGQSWTGQQIVDELRKYDPNFNGTFTTDTIAGLLKDQQGGLRERIALAQQTGHISDAANLQIELSKVVELGDQVHAWPVMQRYADIKKDIEDIKANDSLLPTAKMNAIQRDLDQIGKLADDPSIAGDGHLQSQLRGEASLTEGTVTAWEDMNGISTNGYQTSMNSGNSEVSNLKAIMDQGRQVTDELAKGDGSTFLTQGKYAKDGTFTVLPGGPSYGPADNAAMQGLKGADKAVTVMVPNGDGSGFTPVRMVPMNITVTASDPSLSGLVALKPNATTGLSFIRYSNNGVMSTVYKITDGNGVSRWSAEPPWDPNKVSVKNFSDSMQIDVSKLVPVGKMATVGKNGDMGGGFSLEGYEPSAFTGNYEMKSVLNPITGETEQVPDLTKPINVPGTGKKGKIVIDPAQVLWATVPDRAAAGYDSDSDSFSPTIAGLKHAVEGVEMLKSLVSNPGFQALVANDAMQSSGATLDPAGQVTGSDNSMKWYQKFQQYGQSEADTVTNPTTNNGIPMWWWREDTNTQPQGATWPRYGASSAGAPVPQSLKPTPIDELRNVGDSRLVALYRSVMPNSATLAPKQAVNTSPQITVGQGLKVPSVDLQALPKPVTPAVPTVSPYTAPTVGYTPTQDQTQVPTTRPTYGTTPPPQSGYRPSQGKAPRPY